MTKHTDIIANAMAARGLIPLHFTCGCCGGDLHRDDHMQGHFQDDHAELVHETYGPNVCIGCADDFEPETDCEDCGHAVCTCDDEYDLRKEYGA